MNVFLKFLLACASRLVLPGAESALGYENIDVFLRNFRFHDVSILFTAIISCVEDPHSVDFDDKHGSSHDVPRNVRSELDPILFSLHPELYRTDAFHAVFNMLIVEKSLFSLNFGGVSYQVLVNIFGRTGHIDLTLVIVLMKEVGKGSTVVEMGVGDDDQLDLGWVDLVEKRKTVRILLVYHQPAIEHNFLLVDGENQARAAHLTSRPER
jgi:hypothetical protein